MATYSSGRKVEYHLNGWYVPGGFGYAVAGPVASMTAAKQLLARLAAAQRAMGRQVRRLGPCSISYQVPGPSGMPTVGPGPGGTRLVCIERHPPQARTLATAAQAAGL